MARQYSGRGVEFDDLCQEGVIGLLIAASRFDYRPGCRFSTYACWWIKQRILKAIAEQSRLVRLPASAQRRQRQILACAALMRGETGQPPLAAEVAARLGLRIELVNKTLERNGLRRVVPFNYDDCNAHPVCHRQETAPSPTTRLRVFLERFLSLPSLSERDKAIFLERHGLDDGSWRRKTLKEIGANHGIGRERVRQILNRVNERLLTARAAFINDDDLGAESG